MLFYQYPPVDSPTPIVGMRLARTQDAVWSNIRSAITYLERKEMLFPNTHVLRRILGVFTQYLGSSPQETYVNVELNLRSICNIIGITSHTTSGATHTILGTNDVLVTYQEVSGYARTKGNIEDHPPLLMFNHQWTSNNPVSYFEAQEGTAVLGIDLPLMAAQFHAELLKDDGLSENGYLTKLLSLLMMRTMMWAAFNSVPNWLGIGDDNYPRVTAPFMVINVDRYGEEAAEDIKAYYTYFKHRSVGTLAQALFPMGINRASAVPDLKDFYLDNMQWLGLYLDRSYFKTLSMVDETFTLGLNLKGVENSSRRYISPARLSAVMRVVPNDITALVQEVYS